MQSQFLEDSAIGTLKREHGELANGDERTSARLATGLATQSDSHCFHCVESEHESLERCGSTAHSAALLVSWFREQSLDRSPHCSNEHLHMRRPLEPPSVRKMLALLTPQTFAVSAVWGPCSYIRLQGFKCVT
jgi:hypothetical protein